MCEVVRQNFRLSLGKLGKLAGKSLSYGPMDLPTFTTKQRVIGGVLYECVLERVTGVRWCPSLKYQFCGHELTQLLGQCRFWDLSNCGQQTVGEFPADRSGYLCHFLSLGLPIKPSQ